MYDEGQTSLILKNSALPKMSKHFIFLKKNKTLSHVIANKQIIDDYLNLHVAYLTGTLNKKNTEFRQAWSAVS